MRNLGDWTLDALPPRRVEATILCKDWLCPESALTMIAYWNGQHWCNMHGRIGNDVIGWKQISNTKNEQQ